MNAAVRATSSRRIGRIVADHLQLHVLLEQLATGETESPGAEDRASE